MSYSPANPNGQATMAASAPVVLASDEVVPVAGSLLEELLTDLRVLVANLAGSLPDTAGRTRILLDAVTAGATIAATVSTVATVTNVAQEGGQPANTNVGSLMNVVAYNGLRQQITVS